MNRKRRGWIFRFAIMFADAEAFRDLRGYAEFTDRSAVDGTDQPFTLGRYAGFRPATSEIRDVHLRDLVERNLEED